MGLQNNLEDIYWWNSIYPHLWNWGYVLAEIECPNYKVVQYTL